MMRKLILISILLLFHLMSNGQSGLAYYVSTFGNDKNPGTKEAPFRTIQKAADVAGKVQKDNLTEIHINIREGVYRVDSPIVISLTHSGTEDCRIIFQGYQDERPLISGGVPITGWEPHGDGIWKAPAKGLDFRQLYVNDQRGIRSRQPNTGDYYRLKAWDMAGKRIILRGNQVSRWDQFQRVELVLQQRWAESYLRLKSFSLFGTVGGIDAYVTIQDEEREILFPRPYPSKKSDQVFHFENAYEFLDMPGEWYLDNEADMVYYKPRVQEDMDFIRIIAPRTETLLKIEGTPDHPVENVFFKGITFAHSTWTYPTEHGYLNMQSGQYNTRADSLNNQYIGRPPAAVRVVNARNIQFNRNVFRHLGATAIDLEYGTYSCRVTGNVLHDIAGNGISVGKFTRDRNTEAHVPYNPEDNGEICTNDLISNNVIFRTGRDYYGTNAIVAGYPSGLRIEHNLIRDIPYSGIGVGFGWTSEPNALKDNKIAYNHIAGAVNMMADGAGIYTLSMQPGTHITGNYILGIRTSEWAANAPAAGIYLDEKSGGTDEAPFVVNQNFVQASGFRRHHFHAIGDIVIKNEYYYLHQEGAREIMEHAGLEPEFQDLAEVFREEQSSEIKTRDIVMMTELLNEAEAIKKYEFLHSREGAWPEVVHAARTSGIQKVKIYRFANKLVMIITVPQDLDIEKMNRIYGSSSNRISDWDAVTKELMQTPEGAEEGATWVPMELIHDYKNGMVK